MCGGFTDEHGREREAPLRRRRRVKRRRGGRARGSGREEAAAGAASGCVTRVPGETPWQRGIRGKGQAEESGARG